MTPSRPCVAVIDIGSNSIKALVSRQSDDGTMVTLLSQAIEARISAGINQTPPRLSAEGMQNGLTAITELMALIAPLPMRPVFMMADHTHPAISRRRRSSGLTFATPFFLPFGGIWALALTFALRAISLKMVFGTTRPTT